MPAPNASPKSTDRCKLVSVKTTCHHVRAWASVEKRANFCPAHCCRKAKCELSCDEMEFYCAKRELLRPFMYMLISV